MTALLVTICGCSKLVEVDGRKIEGKIVVPFFRSRPVGPESEVLTVRELIADVRTFELQGHDAQGVLRYREIL